jgi:hypothetical protein
MGHDGTAAEQRRRHTRVAPTLLPFEVLVVVIVLHHEGG